METVYIKLPFQSIFSVSTDSPELLYPLSLQYGDYLKTTSAQDPDFKLSVTAKGSDYWIETAQEGYLSHYPITEIDRFMFEHTVYDPHIFAMHGAAVEWQERCFLFLAPTTAGKTTLTAFLNAHGFGYLTDDCILLDRGDFRIHPCITPLHLRDGGVEILRECGALPPHLERLELSPPLHRWVFKASRCIREPLPLEEIYFIQRDKYLNQCIPMSTTEKMTELMKAPITPYPLNGEYLHFLSRLTKINCFHLIYQDMNYIKEILRDKSHSAT